jgi:hypothetical protein
VADGRRRASRGDDWVGDEWWRLRRWVAVSVNPARWWRRDDFGDIRQGGCEGKMLCDLVAQHAWCDPFWMEPMWRSERKKLVRSAFAWAPLSIH